MDTNTSYIVDSILKRISPSRVFLFGSRSRGEHNSESDYDICVLINEKVNRNHLAMELYKELSHFSKQIDIIVEYEDVFKINIDNKYMIYKDIAKGELIYGE